MAHRKAGGTAKSLRDSKPKYLGIKVADGQRVKRGGILVRQRGTRVLPGANVSMGRDHTLFATTDGVVSYTSKNKITIDGTKRKKRVAQVVSE